MLASLPGTKHCDLCISSTALGTRLSMGCVYLCILVFTMSCVALQGESYLICDTIAEVICLLHDKSGCCSRLASAGYQSLRGFRKSGFPSQVPADLILGLLFRSFRSILCCHLEGDEENNFQASLHTNRKGNGFFRGNSIELKD